MKSAVVAAASILLLRAPSAFATPSGGCFIGSAPPSCGPGASIRVSSEMPELVTLTSVPGTCTHILVFARARKATGQRAAYWNLIESLLVREASQELAVGPVLAKAKEWGAHGTVEVTAVLATGDSSSDEARCAKLPTGIVGAVFSREVGP